MTARKLCPTCDTNNDVTQVICATCGVSLVGVYPSEVAAPAEPPVTSGVPSAGVLCDECGALNTTGSERCIYCDACLNGRPRGISVLTLSWPWGDEEVRDTLVVGRDPPAPPALIARLAEGRFDNVSRQHAKFVVADGKASVVDMGSSNGTFVNGIRLRPNVPAELASGAKLRFGSDLEISVQLIS